MGKNTKNFRQSKSSGAAENAARGYAQMNRAGSWSKILSALKFRRGEIK